MTAITAPETGEARIAKALAHPLRARILARLGERIMAPGDLAAELDAPLGVVSYHVRMLRQYDCVELVRTEPRRGALQHFYRATSRAELDTGSRRALPATLRGELADATAEALFDDMAAAARAGRLADTEAVIARTALELDERAVRKLNRLITRTLDQVQVIAEESATRTGNDVRRTTLGIQHFEREVSE